MKKYIIFVFILCIIEILSTAYIATWRESFWNAVSIKDYESFLSLLLYFTAIALVYCYASAKSTFLLGFIGLHWRTKLVKNYLNRRSNYTHIENYKQRIQEDSLNYTQITLTLAKISVTSVIYVAFYTYLIIKEGASEVFFVSSIYVIVMTLISVYIAKPLIDANYDAQVAEATFRERMTFNKYKTAFTTQFSLFSLTKRFNFTSSLLNQLIVIFPYLLLSTYYFKENMSLGLFMLLAAAINELVSNSTALVSNWSSVNTLIACRKRLKALDANVQ